MAETTTTSAAALSAFPFSTIEIRACLIDSKCWFVAKDVFKALEIVWKGQQSITKIKPEWRVVTNLVTTQINQHGATGEQEKEVILIAEPAVYKIAFRSDKPEAERFTDRVAEIVTTIRKTGHYIAPQAEYTGPVEKYVDLTSHPEVRYIVSNIEAKFWYGGSASFAVYACIRKISGGHRATAFPESQIPAALEELKRLEARANTFFNIKSNFERSAIKWVFGTDAQIIAEPQLPGHGEQLRIAA